MASKPIIAVTRVLPDAGMSMLAEAADIDVRIWPGDLPPSRAELANLVSGASAVISLVTDMIDAELLDQHPSIRTVSNFAVGYDNIDIAAATERSVLVCNTPGVLTETTADLTFALLVSAARRIVEGVEYVRAGKWQTGLHSEHGKTRYLQVSSGSLSSRCLILRSARQTEVHLHQADNEVRRPEFSQPGHFVRGTARLR